MRSPPGFGILDETGWIAKSVTKVTSILNRRRPRRSEVPEPAPSGRLDPQGIAGRQLALDVARQGLLARQVAAGGAVPTAVSAARGVAAALGYQGVAHRRQRLQFADDPVAAPVRALAAAA